MESSKLAKKDGNLRATSFRIMSSLAEHNFRKRKKLAPVTYYEFTHPYPDKIGTFYSGFRTQSADKIFESTDYYKKDSDIDIVK